MTSKTIYYKYSQKYSNLLNEFFNYITRYKISKLDTLPKESHIVMYDEKDINFSTYSNLVLKNLLKKNTLHVLEVRKTGQKELPWKISQPINFIAD